MSWQGFCQFEKSSKRVIFCLKTAYNRHNIAIWASGKNRLKLKKMLIFT
jgi:hypothetical protein